MNFTQEMLLRMKKKAFLANQCNKQRFINLLANELEKLDVILVKHSPGDAVAVGYV